MKVKRHVFLSAFYAMLDVVLSTSPTVFTNSLEHCQSCCSETAADNPLASEEFCRQQGCDLTLDVNGNKVPNQENFGFDCNQISGDFNNPDRKGCELGRDFRFLGSSGVNPSAEAADFCNAGVIGISRDPPVDDLGSPIPVEACIQCCAGLNDLLDFNRDVPPFANDFLLDNCRSSCNATVLCDNFREANDHRARLGCALGFDLARTGQTVLRNNTATCDADGNLVLNDKGEGGGGGGGGGVSANGQGNDDSLAIGLGTAVGVLALAVLVLLARENWRARNTDVLEPRFHSVDSDATWFDNIYGMSGVYSLFSRESASTSGTRS